jgi:uncharacterized membrane protein YhaH (DUF805 family)
MEQRLGAGNYLFWASLLVVGWSALVLVACGVLGKSRAATAADLNLVVSCLGAIFAVVFYWLSSRRLKDLNMPPWLVKVLAFPVLALILMPYLCLVSSAQFENKYGPIPRPSGIGKILLAFLLLFLALGLSFVAFTMYFKTRHILAAAVG